MNNAHKGIIINGLLASGRATLPVVYRLLDLFTTSRAAGAVNGTAAEPGGTDAATRVVSDAGSKAIITNGEFTVLTGAGSETPVLTYNKSYTRVSGLVLAAKCYTATGALATRFMFGWSSLSSGLAYTHRHYMDYANLLTIAGFASLVRSTPRESPNWLVLVLRDAGCYHFVWGGKTGGMTLLHIDRAGTVSPLYPAWTHYTAAPVGVDDLAIPDSVYVPTPLIYDDFNRADGAPGLGWTDRLGVSAIATNVLTFSSLDGGGDGIVTRESGKTNHVTVAKLTRSAGNIGIVTRYADADNYVKIFHDGTNVKIVKRVGGMDQADVASVAVAYSAGKDLEAIWENDTQLRVIYNNTKISDDPYTISDVALLTGTQVGVYSTNTGNTIDDFESHPRGTASEHDTLKGLVVRAQSKKMIVFDGDSLSAGDGVAFADKMPCQAMDLLGRDTYDYYNFAIGGQTMAQCTAGGALKIDPMAGTWSDEICVIWAGTNDLATGASVVDTYAQLLAYVQARKAAGYKVAVLTMVKRGTDASLETKRNQYNALIVANTAGANKIILAGDIAELQDVNNVTYYQGDKTHLTAAGYTPVAALVDANVVMM